MTQAIDKDSLPLNKPRRTPNHPTKSHVVKTKVDGKEKIIRFGEQGAETAGKPKAGESERMKQKRASFKARHGANIAKGPSSAAYWANKVKWADGGSVETKGNGMAEARSIPQNAALGKLAELLNKAKEIGNKVDLPAFGGLGDAMLGATPSEIENWSYGNYPIQTTEMGLPQIKRERKQPLADTAFALGPMVKATKNLPVGLSIKAYHGTPHQFDRFDMSKIGTGEGAQAYGHGLYFAENPNVAEEYRKALTLPNVPYFENGGEMVNIVSPVSAPGSNVWKMRPIEGDIDRAISHMEFGKENISDLLDALVLAKNNNKYGPDYKFNLDGAINKVEQLKNKGYELKRGSSGNIYETSIQWPDAAREAADPLGEHHLLDLDKPYAEQSNFVKEKLLQLNDPHITKAINELPKFNSDGDYWDYMGNSYESKREALEDVTPEDLIRGNRGNFKNPAEVSKLLNQMGIPGSKYLDQGSRTGGGTSNYVMFGDEYPQIVNRARSLDGLQEKYAAGGAVIKAVKSLAKNLNKDLIEKYLSTGKLSPEEIAQYETNAVQMTDSGKHHYNLANANAQGGTPESRVVDLGFDTPAYHGQTRQEDFWGKQPDILSSIDDESGNAELGRFFSTNSPYLAGKYAGDKRQSGAVYPLILKSDDIYKADTNNWDTIKSRIVESGIRNADANNFNTALFENVQDSPSYNPISDFKSNIFASKGGLRSRFAAFDPLRKESSSLLAGTALGDLLLKYASQETSSPEKPDNYAQGGAVQYDPARINQIIKETHG